MYFKGRSIFAAGQVIFATSTFALGTATGSASAPEGGPPIRLSDTGFFASQQRPNVFRTAQFAPRYPLWTDAADKRRWIALPRDAAIDGSRPDAWIFPIGTRFWKEFSYQGHPVETRFMELQKDGSWLFATYLWNEAGTDANLAPPRGVTSLRVRAAPAGRYTVPSRTDCLACHSSSPSTVLGFSALQLSSDRDPGEAALASGSLDLRELVRQDMLRGLPKALVAAPPRIPSRNEVERAALGYLHGNCAHCHNTGPTRVPLALTLAQRTADPSAAAEEVLRSLIAADTRYRARESQIQPQSASPAVVPGDPSASVLILRMQSRNPLVQMPPLGTLTPDAGGLQQIKRWIRALSPLQEP